MKKLSFLILTAAMCVAYGIGHSASSGADEGGISWTLQNDTLTVSVGGNGTGVMDDFPSGVATPWDGQKAAIRCIIIKEGVTNIGEEAFSSCTGLKSVQIASTVANIGASAFAGCTQLQDVYVWSEPVTAIAATAFNGTVNTKLHVPKGKRQAYETAAVWKNFGHNITEFNGGKTGSLTWLLDEKLLTISGTGDMPDYRVWPDNTAIPWYEDRTGVWEIVIEDGVTGIGRYAFEGCENLTSVTIPSSVTKIGNGVFQSCNKLTSITIPASVASIGNYAFGNCRRLASINVDAANAVYSEAGGVLYNKVDSILVAYPGGKSGKAFTTPHWVRIIGANAFSNSYDYNYNPYSLTSITVGEGVREIRDYAFSGCNTLNSLSLPSTIDTLGYSALYNYNMTDLTVNWSTPLNITSKEIYYDQDSISYMNRITLYVPSGKVGAYRAAGTWKNFTNILDYKTGKIGDVEWSLVNGTLTVGGKGDILDYNTVPWYGDQSVSKLIIGDSITSIGDSVFYGLSNLTDIIVYSQTPTVLPDSVFGNISCNLHVPNGSSGNYNAAPVWANFRTVEYLASGLAGKLNWIIEKDTLTISGIGAIPNYNNNSDVPWRNYSWNIKDAIIEEGVTGIGNRAFWSIDNLSSIKISSTVSNISNIGNGAIRYCRNLMSIDVDTANTKYSSEAGILYSKDKSVLHKYPAKKSGFAIAASVKTLDSYSFDYTNLGAVKIPGSVTNIGDNAFNNSTLTSIAIPGTVTNIGYDVFYYCDSLKSISVYSNGSNNGNYITEDSILYTKDKKRLIRYPAAKAGDKFAIPHTVETIAEYAFDGARKLTAIDINTSALNRIELSAFQRCSSLDSIVIPKNVTSILGYTFSSCNNLKLIKVDLENTAYTSIAGVLYNSKKDSMLAYPAMKADSAFTIPSTVKNLTYAFETRNENLKSLVISSSVDGINSDINLPNLTSLTVYQKRAPRLNSDYIYAIDKNTCELKVPVGADSYFMAENYWKDFANISTVNNTITASESKPVVKGNEGQIELSLTIPTDATPEVNSKLEIKFPAGMKLDTIKTALVSSFAQNFTLEFSSDKNTNTWTIKIILKLTKSLNLRATAAEYTKIMDIFYNVDETVADGEKTILIQNVEFKLSDGTDINETELPVTVQIQRDPVTPTDPTPPTPTPDPDPIPDPDPTPTDPTDPTPTPDPTPSIPSGNENADDSFQLTVNSYSLSVNSAAAEQIEVYSMSGSKLFSASKPVGQATFSFSTNQRILIVRGSSGWVRKVAVAL